MRSILSQMDEAFLRTIETTISHSEIQGWAIHLRSIVPKNRILALGDTTSLNALKMVAACWHVGIPIVPIPPHFSTSERTRLLRLTEATHGWKCEKEESLINVSYVFEEKCANIAQPHDFQPISSTKTAAFITTSGSSGTPKIVPIRREQVEWGASYASRQLDFKRSDCWLLTLPISHIGGLSVIYRGLLQGASIWFESEKREISDYFKHHSPITHLSLVPTQLYRWITSSSFELPRNLKAILLGGGPVAPSIIEEVKKHKLPVFYSYGMTETAAVISLQSVNEMNSEVITVGFPAPPNKWKVKGEQKEGELLLKGPQLFEKYVMENNRTEQEDSWFSTGDWVREHPQGLEIIMRRKDRIVTGGENVAPQHLRNIFMTIDGVTDCEIIGLPDEEWGQKITACLEISRSISEEELKALWKNVELPSFTYPKKWLFLTEFPRLETGKVDRKELIRLLNQ